MLLALTAILVVTTKTISKREAFFWTGKLFLGSWCKFLPCLATCESQNASAEEMTKIHTCPFPWMHWNCWLSSNLWLSCIELDCRSECWKVCSEVVEERKTFKTSKSSIPFLKGLHFWKCRHLIELEASMQGRDQGGFRWNQFFTFYNHTSDHREREFSTVNQSSWEKVNKSWFEVKKKLMMSVSIQMKGNCLIIAICVMRCESTGMDWTENWTYRWIWAMCF